MLKNFKPISLILLAGATCFPASIFAETMPSKQGMNISQQNGKVTGTVVDDLGPVAGASVVVKGTTNGNITDMDGNFTLEMETSFRSLSLVTQLKKSNTQDNPLFKSN